MAKSGKDQPRIGTLDLADLPLCLAVARHQSFTGAARSTGTPASTVSRAVGRLEERLGVRLFHRTSRQVTLTPEGARLLERAGPLTDELTEVLQSLDEEDAEPAGLLRVTAPVMSGEGRIGRALVAFAARYRRVRVELHISNSVVDIIEEGFDIAFRGGRMADAGLVARKLWSLPYVLACSPEFAAKELRSKRKLTRDALTRAPAILTSGKTWKLERADGSVVEVAPQEAFRVNHPLLAVQAAIAGLGIACVPAEAIEGTGLVTLTTDLGKPPDRPIYAVFPSRRLVPKRVRLALEWVASWK